MNKHKAESVFALENQESGKVSLVLHEAQLVLESSYLPYTAYARSILFDLVELPESSPAIKTRLHWNSVPPACWGKSSVRRRGRRILQDGPALLLTEIPELPGLQLQARWVANTLEVDAYYSVPSRFTALALLFGQTKARLYAVLTYYLIYFPFIYFFYQSRGWHLLHAGSVASSKTASILAGLPGSGKSTFTLALLAQPEMYLLSDNLLLYDDQQIYAFPEPLHLGATGLQAAGPQAYKLLIDGERKYSHGRKDYYLLPELRRWNAAPEALFFLGQSESFEFKRLSPEQAVERLISYDLLAKESAAYEQFAAALDLINPVKDQSPTGRGLLRRQSLSSLLSRMDCAELWLTNHNLEEAAQWLSNRQYREVIQDPGNLIEAEVVRK